MSKLIKNYLIQNGKRHVVLLDKISKLKREKAELLAALKECETCLNDPYVWGQPDMDKLRNLIKRLDK